MALFDDLRTRGTAADYQLLVERIPYARFLGVHIDAVDEEGLLVRLPFDHKLVGNPNLPALHGGVLGAFLELTAIFELMRQGEGDGLPKPINFTVEYLRTGGPRDLLGRATVTKHGRRVANVRAEAWQEDRAKPCVLGLGHFLYPKR